MKDDINKMPFYWTDQIYIECYPFKEQVHIYVLKFKRKEQHLQHVLYFGPIINFQKIHLSTLPGVLVAELQSEK